MLKVRSDFLMFIIYLKNVRPPALTGIQLCMWYHENAFHDLSCLHGKKKEKSKSFYNIEDQCETELGNWTLITAWETWSNIFKWKSCTYGKGKLLIMSNKSIFQKRMSCISIFIRMHKVQVQHCPFMLLFSAFLPFVLKQICDHLPQKGKWKLHLCHQLPGETPGAVSSKHLYAATCLQCLDAEMPSNIHSRKRPCSGSSRASASQAEESNGWLKAFLASEGSLRKRSFCFLAQTNGNTRIR